MSELDIWQASTMNMKQDKQKDVISASAAHTHHCVLNGAGSGVGISGQVSIQFWLRPLFVHKTWNIIVKCDNLLLYKQSAFCNDQ